MPSDKKYSKAMKKGMSTATQKRRIQELERYEPYPSSMKERYTRAYGERKTVGDRMVKPAMSAGTTSGRWASGASKCADPSCRQCKREREREYGKLPKYYTGLRVTVSDVGPRKKAATVINLSGSGLPKNHVAVCFDKPVGPDLAESMLEEFTKPGYGMFIPKVCVAIREDQQSYRTFREVPRHVGVVVTEDTRVDNVTFKAGQTGRIVAQPNGAESRLMVNWNFPNKNFYDASGSDSDGSGDIPRETYPCCYNVPRGMLALCRLDNKNRVEVIWPNSGQDANDCDFKKGDYLRTIVAEGQRITNGERNFRIDPGTIMRYQGQVDRQRSQVVLAGGCDPSIIGVPTIAATRGLEKLEEEFIDAGKEVEITATVGFRKRDLKGMRAVVILPLDQDGEVGLQFKEDIAAGSLDGYGEDKKCLYIHHSAMKKVSG